LTTENPIAYKVTDPQEQKKEAENPSKVSVMNAVLIKKGEYSLSNSFVLPSLDVCLLGEPGTILVPNQNVLPIIGLGNKNLKCSGCGYILAMTIKRPQIQNLTIKFPSCGCLNQF
jgi:hypothetical protein